jgi:hypothetical protein
VESFNKRSFFSVIVFLSSVPPGGGGGTRFYADKGVVDRLVCADGRWTAPPSCGLAEEVRPEAGRVLVFDQEMAHEGAPTPDTDTDIGGQGGKGQGGRKYILRTDVLSERRPAVCDSPSDREAFSLLRRGEEMSERGQVDQAIALFKKAFKISPTLAALSGQP